MNRFLNNQWVKKKSQRKSKNTLMCKTDTYETLLEKVVHKR